MIVRVLIAAVLCLALADIVTLLYNHGYLAWFLPIPDPNANAEIDLFSLDEERNIPTWYSSSTLLVCSVLFATIAAAEKRGEGRYLLHWRALSIVFLLMSMDEAVSIHQRTSSFVAGLLNTSGLLYYAWVVPATAFLLVFALTYLKFFLDLPQRVRRLLLVSGVLYTAGALGLEMIEGLYVTSYGSSEDIAYALLTSSEELLEMIAIVVLIYVLMLCISTQVKGLRLYTSDEKSKTTFTER
jgi:hypothetical protein